MVSVREWNKRLARSVITILGKASAPFATWDMANFQNPMCRCGANKSRVWTVGFYFWEALSYASVLLYLASLLKTSVKYILHYLGYDTLLTLVRATQSSIPAFAALLLQVKAPWRLLADAKPSKANFSVLLTGFSWLTHRWWCSQQGFRGETVPERVISRICVMRVLPLPTPVHLVQAPGPFIPIETMTYLAPHSPKVNIWAIFNQPHMHISYYSNCQMLLQRWRQNLLWALPVLASGDSYHIKLGRNGLNYVNSVQLVPLKQAHFQKTAFVCVYCFAVEYSSITFSHVAWADVYIDPHFSQEWTANPNCQNKMGLLSFCTAVELMNLN